MDMEGIFTPVITPHAPDGTIDEHAFREVVDWLVTSGVHCVVVGGSTGEYYAQTIEERIHLARLAHDVISGRTQLMVGVGATRTEDAVGLGVAARELGADSILVNSPPYAVPTDRENALHALAIDRAVGLPIMLYNYPHRTGTDMGPEYLDRVGRSPNFRAIKESSGSVDRLHLLARDYPHIVLGCGMDDQALEFFAWGARVWVCAGSNFLPAEHIALYEACAVKGDFDTGRRIMSALLPLLRVLEQGGKFVQAVKYGCEIVGLPAGPPRRPLLTLNKDERRQMREVVATVRSTVAAILQEVPRG
jgi:4-hydroxy-tetrahydrodipicolinate synthase